MEIGFVSPNCLTLSEKHMKLSQMDDDPAWESRDFLNCGADRLGSALCSPWTGVSTSLTQGCEQPGLSAGNASCRECGRSPSLGVC